jgi:hypothetical protein
MAKEPTCPTVDEDRLTHPHGELSYDGIVGCAPGEQHENQTFYGLLLTRERARLDERTRLFERSQMHPLVDLGPP